MTLLLRAIYHAVLLIFIVKNIYGLQLLPHSLTDVINTAAVIDNNLIKKLIKDVAPKIPTFTKKDQPKGAIEEFEKGMDDEDIDLNITQLITKNKCPVETYEVCTKDGYILTMFRIPNEGGIPVFLMHGIVSSADDYVTNGHNNSLPFLLARKGYDVWLGNARGNKHSKKHVSLSPDKDEDTFWHFSWDEIGRYDLPAMIDFILQTTHYEQLVYIGHSQGSTSYFVLTSELSEYNKKIKCTAAMSVPVFLARNNSPLLQILARLASHEDDLLVKFIGPKVLDGDLTDAFYNVICEEDTDAVTQLVCSGALFLIAGFNYEQAHYGRMGTILNHLGSSAATNQLVHYAQSIVHRGFKRFDFGFLKNKKMYGSVNPPNYNLENITGNIAIFHGPGDWLSVPQDVKELINNLVNAKLTYFEIPDQYFAHLDYVYAKDATKLLYNDVLKYIEQCWSSNESTSM